MNHGGAKARNNGLERPPSVGINSRDIARWASRSIPARDPRLFSKFLPKGYGLVTLSCVDQRFATQIEAAKICLGSLITGLDDLADDPAQYDPDLLDQVYLLFAAPKGTTLPIPTRNREFYIFIRDLLGVLRTIAAGLPHYATLSSIFQFDLLQINLANRYHQNLTRFPSMANPIEMKTYGPFNMGMIAAHMIDLMATPGLSTTPLGICREIFWLGQRYGRICNQLATQRREEIAGDITSELAHHPDPQRLRATLMEEQRKILAQIGTYDCNIFHLGDYAKGLMALHELHRSAAYI